MAESTRTNKGRDDFVRAAARRQSGVVGELAGFLAHNKKWWLAPIIILLVIVGVFIILGATGAAPFIYTLF